MLYFSPSIQKCFCTTNLQKVTIPLPHLGRPSWASCRARPWAASRRPCTSSPRARPAAPTKRSSSFPEYMKAIPEFGDKFAQKSLVSCPSVRWFIFCERTVLLYAQIIFPSTNAVYGLKFQMKWEISKYFVMWWIQVVRERISISLQYLATLLRLIKALQWQLETRALVS